MNMQKRNDILMNNRSLLAQHAEAHLCTYELRNVLMQVTSGTSALLQPVTSASVHTDIENTLLCKRTGDYIEAVVQGSICGGKGMTSVSSTSAK